MENVWFQMLIIYHLLDLTDWAGTLEEIRNQGLELLGVVPHDDQVYQYDCDGKPIIQLPKDSPVRSALGEIVKKLGL